jgi:NAD(P)H dehydrogenase (quinone)
MTHDTQPVLVYGATGAQGGPVARRLLAQGRRVRVLARDAQKAQPLAQQGAEVAIGDFDDADSLRRASEGVAAVFLHLPIVPPPLIQAYGTAALKAAEAARVPYIVFSTSGPAPDNATPLAELEAKRAIFQRVLQGPVPAAVLRPTVFLENLLGPWSLPPLLEHGVLAYPHPEELPVAWSTHEDVAAAALAALARPELAGQLFDLGGPETLRGNQLAAGFAQALGRPVAYRAKDPEEFTAGLRPVIGDAGAEAVEALYRWMTTEGQANLQRPRASETAATLGYTPTPFAQWLRAVAVPAAQQMAAA